MYYLHGHIVSGICMIMSIQHHNLQFRSYLVLSPLFPVVSMHHHTHTCNIYDIKGKMFSEQDYKQSDTRHNWKFLRRFGYLHKVIKVWRYSFVNFASNEARCRSYQLQFFFCYKNLNMRMNV